MRAGDLHLFGARPDQPGVRVGDDLAHQVGALRGLGDLVDPGADLVGRQPERLRGGVGADVGDLGADRRVLQHDLGELGARARVEGDTLQPPSGRGDRKADRRHEEEQSGHATTTWRVSRMVAVTCGR